MGIYYASVQPEYFSIAVDVEQAASSNKVCPPSWWHLITFIAIVLIVIYAFIDEASSYGIMDEDMFSNQDFTKCS